VLAAGETLEVLLNGVTYSVGADLVDNGDNTWTLTIPPVQALADGTYSVTARVTDLAGNVVLDPDSDELTVDTVVPTAPDIVALVTTDSTPTLMGTANPGLGEALTVEVNGIVYGVGTGVIDNGDGTWELTIPAADSLNDGVFDVTVTITDAAGNSTSETSNGELTVDTTPPANPAVAPDLIASDDTGDDDADNLTALTAVTYSTPAGTGVTGDSVELFADGVSIGTGTVAADGGFSIATSPLLEGPNLVVYQFTDAAGNTSALSPSLLTTVDTTIVPTGIATPIEADDIVNASEESDVLITGSAEIGAVLELTIDDGVNPPLAATTVVDSLGAWSFLGNELDISSLNQGTLTIDAVARDAAGNTAAASPVTIEHVSVVPEIPVVTALTINTPTPTVTGTATIDPGDSLTVEVDGFVYVAGAGDLVTNGDGTWTLVIPADKALIDAVYAVTAIVTDVAANSSVDTTTDELTIDTVAPAAPVVTPLVTSDTTPSIEISATLQIGDDLEVSVNGQSYLSSSTDLVDNEDGTWLLTIPAADALADNIYPVAATVTDVAGNASVDADTDELIVDTQAPTAPTVNALISNSITPTLTGSAVVGPAEVLTVAVNGVVYTAGDGDLTDNGDSTWTLNIPASTPVSEGVFDVVVTVTDAANNSTSESSIDELTVDITPPTSPLIAPDLIAADDTGASDSDDVTFTDAPVFATPPGTATADTVVTILADGNPVGSGNVAADGGFSLQSSTLADGSHDISYTLTDDAGNVSSASPILQITIDTQMQLPTIDQPVAVDDVINSSERTQLLLSGTAETGSDVTITIDDGVNPQVTTTVVGDALGQWTLLGSELDVSTLDNGALDISVAALDLAGNSATSLPFFVVLDTALPVVPVVDLLVTNQVTPVLSGTAVLAPDEQLTVEINGITYTDGDGNLTHDGTANWTLTIPASDALPEAEYFVTARVTDLVGNQSVDLTANELRVDLTPPAVPVVDSLTVNQPLPVITVHVSPASDETFSIEVNGVTYPQNSPLIFDNEDGSWNLSIDGANALPDAVYDVLVTVTDEAGNSSVDATSDELVVSSGRPFIYLLPVTGDDYVNATEAQIPVQVNGTVVNAEPGNQVRVSVDADFLYNTILTGSSWTITIPLADLSEFDGTVAVRADVENNAAVAADTAQSSVVFDTQAPVVTVAPPVAANAENQLDYPLSGTCTAGDGDVQITVAGATPAVSFATCESDGTWSTTVDVSALLDDPAALDIGVSQEDAAENVSPVVMAVAVKDTVDPEIFIDDDGANGDEFVNAVEEGAVSVAGTTTGVESGQVVTLQFTDGDSTVTTTTTVDIDGNWLTAPLDLSSLNEGIVDLFADVSDVAGNSAETAEEAVTIDRTEPAGSTVNPGTTYDSTPVIAGTTDLPDGSVITVTHNNGDPVCSAVVDAGQWECESDLELPQGENTLIVSSMDPAGNIEIIELELTIDETLDTDGDGIPDLIEGEGDTDGDGTPDFQDPDSDGDGISDQEETAVDSDDDGIPDYIDPDSDDDGIDDALEQSGDADGDGIPDYLDVDSDGDGVPDSDEGITDLDGDGVPDYLDPDFVVDSDGDGIPDSVEGTGDSDSDGVPDNIDTDSDGDGIADSVETAGDSDNDGTPDYLDPDSDGDGIDDVEESTVDTDGDGLSDFQDPDSDGDGIDDILEGTADTDNDGIVDRLDQDSDNDGISDEDEGADDVDGDGVIDARDIDSDNDGITDLVESFGIDANGDGQLDNFTDVDLDGFDDETGAAARVPRDTDSDGIPDHVDYDSDNDTIPDALEVYSEDINRDGEIDGFVDSNGDGLDDGIAVAPTSLPDSDFDGVPDHLDVDSDNDGIPDAIEVLAQDQNVDGLVDAFTDVNNNGLHDSSELASLLPDSDGDGIPDYLELDSDNDGLNDLAEANGVDANGDGVVDSMADADRDGIPDVVDVDVTGGADVDGDGIDDSADVDFLFLADSDGDGIVDIFDPDANGDGFADAAADQLQLGQAIPDANNNGTPDFQEAEGNALVETGVNGVGCSIVSARR
ncbi:MAG: hypothetical protein KTR33_00555, partial [Gammaproteobacteria bacterium]|nr:hypothetical protein [Gammaproteobacteria bacterium]